MGKASTFMRRLWPVLFLALIPILPLWRCVFMGEAIGPFDQIRQMQPWNGPKAEQPWDVLQADGVLQFYPWRDMVFRSYAEGHLPFWNHYELAGTPLLANSQSAGFYPPHILVGVLHVPTAPAMVILAWFHLFWAALGVYFLSRRLSATRSGSALAGSSFTLSAFMLLWTALPSVISTVAWIPWALAATVGLFQPARPVRSGALLAFSLGMMILAGHLQFVAYGFFSVALVGIWLGLLRGSRPAFRLQRLGVLLLCCVGGFALAAPQLLTVLNYSQYSHRKQPPTEAGYQDYLGGAIKPFELANLVYPYSLGSPRKAYDAGSDRIGEYWPGLAKRGANLAESAVTIGPIVLALLFLVPWKRRELWPIAGVGVFALLLAMGTALNYPLYFAVPGWSSTGSPGRIVVLFVLACCTLAGIGMGRGWLAADRAKWSILGTSALAAITLAFAQFAPAWLPGLEEIGSALKNGTYVNALVMVLATTALVVLALAIATGRIKLSRFKKPSATWRMLACAPLLLFIVTCWKWNPVTTGAPLEVKVPSSFGRVAVMNSGWEIFVAAQAVLPPNTAYFEGLHEIGGYDSLLHRDTKALLDEINGQDSAPPANGNMIFIKPKADPIKLAEAGVSQVIRFGQTIPTPLPGTRASLPGGTAEITSEHPQGLQLRASGPGRLVLHDRKMSGWGASMDGKAVPLQGTTWMEVDVPAGEHTLQFSYTPPRLSTGLSIGIPAWLALIGLMLVGRRSHRLSKEPASN